LEACTHLIQQLPFRFEFTERYLHFIANMAYCAAFVEFMGDSEVERREIVKRMTSGVTDEDAAAGAGNRDQWIARALLMELGLASAEVPPRDPASSSKTSFCTVLEGLRYAESVATQFPGLLFLNPAFSRDEAFEGEGACGLVPVCDPAGLQVWRKYHLRFSAATASERFVTPSLRDWLWEMVAGSQEREGTSAKGIAQDEGQASADAEELQRLRELRGQVEKLVQEHRNQRSGRARGRRSDDVLNRLEAMCKSAAAASEK